MGKAAAFNFRASSPFSSAGYSHAQHMSIVGSSVSSSPQPHPIAISSTMQETLFYNYASILLGLQILPSLKGCTVKYLVQVRQLSPSVTTSSQSSPGYLQPCRALGRALCSRAALLSVAPTPLRAGEMCQAHALEKEAAPGAFCSQFPQTSRTFPYATVAQAPSLRDMQYLSFLWIFPPPPSPEIFIQLEKQQREGVANGTALFLLLGRP